MSRPTHEIENAQYAKASKTVKSPSFPLQYADRASDVDDREDSRHYMACFEAREDTWQNENTPQCQYGDHQCERNTTFLRVEHDNIIAVNSCDSITDNLFRNCLAQPLATGAPVPRKEAASGWCESSVAQASAATECRPHVGLVRPIRFETSRRRGCGRIERESYN